MRKPEAEGKAWKIRIDQCAYGLVMRDDKGEIVPARKTMTFLTNSPVVSILLNKRCPGCRTHGRFLGKDPVTGQSRARMLQVYPQV